MRALVLVPLLIRQRQLAALRAHAVPLVVVGLSNSAIPFLCFGYAALHISAGLSSIFNAATPLSLPDRFFGAVFGLLRGVLIALVITTMVLWTPLAKTEVWKASWVASTLTEWARQLQPFFPQWPGFKAWLPDKLEVPSAPSLF